MTLPDNLSHAMSAEVATKSVIYYFGGLKNASNSANMERILKINTQSPKKGWEVILINNPHSNAGWNYGTLPLGLTDKD